MNNYSFILSDYSDRHDHFLCDKYHNYQLISTMLASYDKLKYIEVIKEGDIVNAYVVLVDVEEIRILNSFYIYADEQEIDEFINFLFSKFNVCKINWNSIISVLPITSISVPCLFYNRIEDNIAYLPDTYSDYMNSLGRQTKKHSKYYINRLSRDFSNVKFEYIKGPFLAEEDLEHICRFSSERIASKYLKYIDDTQNLKVRIKHHSAFAFVLRIDNSIQAGCLGYILGQHSYLVKISHNVEFNRYNLGNIVLLKLIEYCIEHNVRYFHFLWGKNVDYKSRYKGIETALYDYVFYREKNIGYYKDGIYLCCKKRITWFVEFLKNNKQLLKLYRRIRYVFRNNENDSYI